MEDFLLKSVSGYLIPFINMYGAYVVLHGHLSPGGGFSGGIIIALGFILLAVAFETEKGLEPVPFDIMTMLYIGMAFVGLLKGGSMAFDIALPLGVPGTLFSSGWIFVITLGVGIVVAATIITLFYCLMEETERKGGEQA